MDEIAHRIEEKERTSDVKLTEKVPFSKMLLADSVRKGLNHAGFKYPTVIQANAIPTGKAGIDLFVQSKSGTGKTLIFCTVLLEAFQNDVNAPQALILAPTREIAVQIEHTLMKVGRFVQGFKVVSIIGGLDVGDDRKKLQGAKAVVGTPGRVLHLIQNSVLNTSHISLLVLDEADKLMTQTFQRDVKSINSNLPSKRQVIACSATLGNDLDKTLAAITKDPLLITTDNRSALLVGIKQFVYELPEEKTSILEMNAKLAALKRIFSKVSFKQCLAFAGSQSRADSYRNLLEKEGWPCEVICGSQAQKLRLEKFQKFREFKTRIVITTDLMSRGIDSENVNLVINVELPNDAATYLHRIGRAGRFGSHGITISFVSSNKEREQFSKLLESIGPDMKVLKFPEGNMPDLWNFNDLEAEQKNLGVFNLNPDTNSTNVNKDIDKHEECKPEISEDLLNQNKQDKNNSNNLKVELLLSMIDKKTDFNENHTNLKPIGSASSNKVTSNSAVTLDDASSITADSDVLQEQEKDEGKNRTSFKPELKPKPIQVSKMFLDQKKKKRSPFADLVINSEKSSIENRISDIFDDYKKAVVEDDMEIEKDSNESQKNIADKLIKTTEKSNPKSEESINLNKTYSKDISLPKLIPEFKSLVIDVDASESSNSDLFADYEKQDSKKNSTDSNQSTTTGPTTSTSSVPAPSTSSDANKSTSPIPSSSGVTYVIHKEVPSSSDSENEIPQPPEERRHNTSRRNDRVEELSESGRESISTDSNPSILSSGFDEKTSSVESSGIVTSTDYHDSSEYTDNSSSEDGVSSCSYETSSTIETLQTSSHETEEIRPQRIAAAHQDYNFQYQSAYANWTNMYWNQMTQIRDYVRFCSYVRQSFPPPPPAGNYSDSELIPRKHRSGRRRE